MKLRLLTHISNAKILRCNFSKNYYLFLYLYGFLSQFSTPSEQLYYYIPIRKTSPLQICSGLVVRTLFCAVLNPLLYVANRAGCRHFGGGFVVRLLGETIELLIVHISLLVSIKSIPPVGVSTTTRIFVFISLCSRIISHPCCAFKSVKGVISRSIYLAY